MTMWANIKSWVLWQWARVESLWNPDVAQLFKELEEIRRVQMNSRMMTMVPRYSMRCECDVCKIERIIKAHDFDSEIPTYRMKKECDVCKIRPLGIIPSRDFIHCDECGRDFVGGGTLTPNFDADGKIKSYWLFK